MSDFKPTVIHEGLTPSGKCQLVWDTNFKVQFKSEVFSFDKYSEAYHKYCDIMNIPELPPKVALEENQYQNHFKKIKVFMIISVCWSLMAMMKNVGSLDVLTGFVIINLMGLVSTKFQKN